MNTLRNGLNQALRALLFRPVNTILAVGTIAMALLLAGTVWLASRHLDRYASTWARGVVVAVYLAPSADGPSIDRVRQALQRLPGAIEVRFVSKKEAFDRLKKNLGTDGKSLKGIEPAWLPASFQVTLRGSRRTLKLGLGRLTTLGKALPAVEEVRTLERWHKKLDSIARMMTYMGSALAVLTLLACAYIVAVTVRTRMLHGKQETEVKRLLGATRMFVSAPLLMEGALFALLGSLLAIGLLYGLNAVLVPRIVMLAGPYIQSSVLTFLSWPTLVWALALTTSVGLVGSRMAIGKLRHV